MCTAGETCLTCGLDCGPCAEPDVTGNCVTVGHYAITINGAPTTAQLDALSTHSAEASFVITGDEARASNATFTRAVADGHTLMSGSNNMTSWLTLPVSGLAESLASAEDAIQLGSCRRPRIVRPPQGLVTRSAVVRLAELGYRAVSWNFDTGAVDVQTLRQSMLTLNTTHLSVVHQMPGTTSAAHLEAVIDVARQSGYVCPCVCMLPSLGVVSCALTLTVACDVSTCGRFTLVDMDTCLYGNTGAFTAASTAYSRQPTIRSPQRCHDAWTTSNNANCVLSLWSAYSPCANTFDCSVASPQRVRTRVVASPNHNIGSPCNPLDMVQYDTCSASCTCGDGTCSISESCASCPADCGPCASETVLGGCASGPTSGNPTKSFMLGLVGFPSASSWAVLDALTTAGAKATLFVDPDLVAGAGAGLVQAAAGQGHQIATDAYASVLHAIKPGTGFKTLAAELGASVKAATCQQPRLMAAPRPPAKLAPAHLDALSAVGYQFLNYTWAPSATDTSAQVVVEAQGAMISGAPVVGLLDVRQQAVVDALPSVLSAISSQGYTIISADQCRCVPRLFPRLLFGGTALVGASCCCC